MISPKYSYTNYYFNPSKPRNRAPNVVNLYLDYNCPFSAKLFSTFQKLALLMEASHPGAFQFVFVNVVQPWHPSSVMLHEYALVVGRLLRQDNKSISNEMFWKVCESLFRFKEHFYDSSTANLSRNEMYEHIYEVTQKDLGLIFDKDIIMGSLKISEQKDVEKASNGGNAATDDIKYFTRYVRTVGVHVTPTVSVNGIVNDSISSSSSIKELFGILEGYLKQDLEEAQTDNICCL